jgi:glycosyltransferase involved in cell wall biosynthesis
MRDTVLRIELGIFAWNEADVIRGMLDDLAQQSIFYNSEFESIRLCLVANGCNDDTVSVFVRWARENPIVKTRVIDLEKPGKSNAWNVFIHHADNELADIFVCMDADIRFGGVDCISLLVKNLINTPHARVSASHALKDRGHFSKLVSSLKNNGVPVIAGSLYAGWGKTLRLTHMPVGLPVEDGFLRAMVVTDGFTTPDDPGRVCMSPAVFHFFTPYLSPFKLFRHEQRLVLGSAINSIIYGKLWQIVSESGEHAGIWISLKNAEDPAWVERLIGEWCNTHRKVVPSNFYLSYMYALKAKPWYKKVLFFPVAVTATLVQCLVCFRVQKRLRHGVALGFW